MPEQPTSSPQGKKLLDVVRDVLRTKHRVASPCRRPTRRDYSYRTEQTYRVGLRRGLDQALHPLSPKAPPKDMGEDEIQREVLESTRAARRRMSVP